MVGSELAISGTQLVMSIQKREKDVKGNKMTLVDGEVDNFVHLHYNLPNPKSYGPDEYFSSRNRYTFSRL